MDDDQRDEVAGRTAIAVLIVAAAGVAGIVYALWVSASGYGL